MSDAPRPVPVIEHCDNGLPTFRGAHLDGQMHGEWTFYRRDGSVMRSGSVVRGRQAGRWRTFDRAGRVAKGTRFPEAAG